MLPADLLKFTTVADQTRGSEQGAVDGGHGRNGDRDTKLLAGGRGVVGFELAVLATLPQYGMNFFGEPRGQILQPIGINRGSMG